MNITNNNNSSHTPILFDQQLRLVEQIVLTTMFISALIGNILVLIVMLTKRNRRTTRMAFFILHLTIADLLVAIFSVLPMFIWKTMPTFFDGDIICRLVTFLMLFSTYISVYTLVVMTIDRYQAIVHPLSTYTWTSHTGLFYMIAVWCLSIILALPQLFIFRSEYDPINKIKGCRAKFLGTDKTWELAYIVWTIVVQFFLPICVLLYCYGSVYLIVNRNFSMYRLSDNARTMSMANLPAINIPKNLSNLSSSIITLDRNLKSIRKNHIHIHYPSVECSSVSTVIFNKRPPPSVMYPVVFRLRRSSFEVPPSPHYSSISLDRPKVQPRYGASHFLSRARLKTIKLTFIVVLAYILCSTPFYIGSIVMAVNGKFLSQKTMNWLMTIFSLLLNLNSCSNPIICLTLSSTLFRRKRDHKEPLVVSKKSQTNNEKNVLTQKNQNLSKHFLFL
ncbi:unnamed protein product [Adineta steineri]|uniref:G-protein coupled receptors family 1 profile domain-containing protein n=1 Tax=Adineta steineri TaxID=433720 RepID=A0A818YDP5_9BILA|nr:unnamed protein product [Adineta steineri]CAF3751926.1 unnamed protein product [Adineta steineri]